MEIELLEIREFLAQREPFSSLPPAVLDQLPRDMEIRYLRRQSPFPPQDTTRGYLYIIRSGCIDLRNSDGNLAEKLGEGDLYTTECQLVDLSEGLRGTAAEDSLIYLIGCETLQELKRQSEDFNRHFSASLRERLQLAVRRVQGLGDNTAAYMTVEVKDLIRKQAITIDAATSIQEAARVMTGNSVSSVMIMEDGKLAGLITDRDLRMRCVAEGLAVTEPVSRIMTTEVETIEDKELVIQALLTMTRLHVHHLPVVQDGHLVGMLTASDLARHQATNSAFIATDIRKSQTIGDLAQVSRKLPELQLQLANSSATALHIGEAISCITDSITNRLLEMAEEQLGPPPVPYVWVAGGSQARREQTSHSDQDNALIIDDEMSPADDKYFEKLARFVSDGLNACGFYYCPGDAMATNPQWRQPLSVWRRYFDDWIHRPEPKALMLSSIFFDLRAIGGATWLLNRLQHEVLEKTRQNRIFIAFMAANALQHRPPLGFFRTFVLISGGEHDDTFDIKHRGIVPITDLARVYALSEGLTAVNTTERLREARECGALSGEMGENLEDALEFIASLRIQHQASQIRNGQAPNNYLAPDGLSELEREHLKDAFKVIQTMQETLSNRYQGGRFT
jgi:CBS domain-containing protein